MTDRDIRLAQSGDPEAKERIVTQFYPLCRKLARQKGVPGAELKDRIAIAQLGLLKAIARFDPGRETSFMTFAHIAIGNELLEAMREARGQFVAHKRNGEPMRARLASEKTWAKIKSSVGKCDQSDLVGKNLEDVLRADCNARLNRFIDLSLAEVPDSHIAVDLGISQSRASQLRRRLQTKLKALLAA